MKFNQFKISPAVEVSKAVYKHCESRLPLLSRMKVSKIFQLCDEWSHIKKPFYRIYPGYINAVEKIDFHKFPWNIELPITPIAFEFPETFHYIALTNNEDSFEEIQVESVLIKAEDGYFSGVIYGNANGVYTNCLLPNLLENHNGEIGFLERIILGIQLIKDDIDLFKPVLLKRDSGKPITPDRVSRAIRNGVYGFDIGEPLPTKEEIEQMRKAGTLREGEKAPHFRTSYFGLRWTGAGRATPKIVRVKECFVGMEKIKKIPTGYYDEK